MIARLTAALLRWTFLRRRQPLTILDDEDEFTGLVDRIDYVGRDIYLYITEKEFTAFPEVQKTEFRTIRWNLTKRRFEAQKLEVAAASRSSSTRPQTSGPEPLSRLSLGPWASKGRGGNSPPQG